MGVDDDTAIAKEVLHSGILAGVLMALIYMLTILMGAQSLGLFAVSENGGKNKQLDPREHLQWHQKLDQDLQCLIIES